MTGLPELTDEQRRAALVKAAEARRARAEIKELLNTFEPRATFTNVMTTSDGNELDVTVMFSVGNSPEPHSLDLVLERVR